ncbi:MAG: hypothetical protein KAS23_13420 [Anaerohalosphaera sp.]|nr:hypothetical protein [Anaerohalosphaera sp.]
MIRCVINLRILLIFLCCIFFLGGCGKKNVAKIEWSTSGDVVKEKIPLLTLIDSCVFQNGKKTVHGRGLPAPDEYFIRGYAKISNEQKDKLVKNYKWDNVVFDTSKLLVPDFPSIADDFLKSTSFKESSEFMRDHKKKSSFSVGLIVLDDASNILYFDLSNL